MNREQIKESIRGSVQNAIKESVSGDQLNDANLADGALVLEGEYSQSLEEAVRNFDYSQIDESFKGALAAIGLGASTYLAAIGLIGVGALVAVGGALAGGAAAGGFLIAGGVAVGILGGVATRKLKKAIDFREFEKLDKKLAKIMQERDAIFKQGVEEGDPSKYKREAKKLTKLMQKTGKQLRQFYADHKDLIEAKLTRSETSKLENMIEAAEKGRLTAIKDIAQGTLASM
jgi:hypothetical protein